MERLPEESQLYIRRQEVIEALAEEILVAKQQVVDLDRKRNKNREALGVMRRNELDSGKAWICVGELFVKLPQNTAKSLIERDQKNLDAEIDRLRMDMKTKTAELNRIENNVRMGDPSRGFLLNSLSRDEAQRYFGSQ